MKYERNCKLIRRKLKNLEQFIFGTIANIKNEIDIQKNNQILLTLFDPLFKKLARRYSRCFNVDRNTLYEFLETESLSLFKEYDYSKNDNFPAFLKFLLDRRVLYYCQKYKKIENMHDHNIYDLESLKKDVIFSIHDGRDKLKEYFYLLSSNRPILFRKIVYYLIFRNLKEVEIAKKLCYSHSRISQIVKEIKYEIVRFTDSIKIYRRTRVNEVDKFDDGRKIYKKIRQV